ncbi:P-loop NTPase family protein [Streptomyces daliensis]
MPRPKKDDAEVDVVGALKGGTGKTRLAMLMAILMAVRRKESVLYVEGDTVSQTGSHWDKDLKRAVAAGIAPAPLPVTVRRHPFDDIDEFLDEERASGEWDRIVCDIGGGNPGVFSAALTRAKRLYVPIGADPSEVRNLAGTWRAARLAGAESVVGGFDAWVVLSRTAKRSRLRRQYREMLTAGTWQGQTVPIYPVTETELVRRVAYQEAYGTVPTDFLDVPALMVETGVLEKGDLDA